MAWPPAGGVCLITSWPMITDEATSLIENLKAQLAAVPGPLVLGFSGGLDSSVLFSALVRGGFRHRLTAVHVQHGLQAMAESWAEHCRAVAAAAGVPFDVVHLELAAGPDLEQRARLARRAALLAAATPDGALLLAQHADDQAETLLLRLLRGAGPAGLAAMRTASRYRKRLVLRPLLPWRRPQLAALAQHWGLTWVEDPTNAEIEADRNYLRHEILPRLAQRWPAVVEVFGRNTAVQHETAQLLAELAAEDRAALGLPDGAISLSGLQRLGPARQRNLLYGWVRARGWQAPPRQLLQRVLDELICAAPDRQPRVEWPEGAFCRHRDGLYLLPHAALQPLTGAVPLLLADGAVTTLGPLTVTVRRLAAGEPAGAEQWVLPVDVSAVTVSAAPAGARIRSGGLSREVRESWRAAGVPPWLRARWPVLLDGDELLAAAQLGCADGYQRAPGAPGWAVAWHFQGADSAL